MGVTPAKPGAYHFLVIEEGLSVESIGYPSDKTGLTTPESDPEKVLPFANSTKGLHERLEKMINRLKVLSIPKQEEILTSWENILDNLEHRQGDLL